MTHEIKKKVMITVHKEKNRKTKKLPRLGIYIKFGFWVAGLAVLAGLIHAFGASISTIVGVYLGYKLLRLAIRIFQLIVSLLVSIVTAVILIIIISLLIF
jgi:hypothetical protein